MRFKTSMKDLAQTTKLLSKMYELNPDYETPDNLHKRLEEIETEKSLLQALLLFAPIEREQILK